jgi:hypothetical protein
MKAVALLFLCICLCGSWTVHGQWTGPDRDNAENLTAMINAYYQGRSDPEWGAGIIVAHRDSTLYIATAKHVLTKGRLWKIDVAFRWMNSNSEDKRLRTTTATVAKPLESLDPSLDLAVIKVQLTPDLAPSPDALLFSSLADPGHLKTNAAVRPVGHGDGKLWHACNSDTLDTVSQDSNELEQYQ